MFERLVKDVARVGLAIDRLRRLGVFLLSFALLPLAFLSLILLPLSLLVFALLPLTLLPFPLLLLLLLVGFLLLALTVLFLALARLVLFLILLFLFVRFLLLIVGRLDNRDPAPLGLGHIRQRRLVICGLGPVDYLIASFQAQLGRLERILARKRALVRFFGGNFIEHGADGHAASGQFSSNCHFAQREVRILGLDFKRQGPVGRQLHVVLRRVDQTYLRRQIGDHIDFVADGAAVLAAFFVAEPQQVTIMFRLRGIARPHAQLKTAVGLIADNAHPQSPQPVAIQVDFGHLNGPVGLGENGDLGAFDGADITLPLGRAPGDARIGRILVVDALDLDHRRRLDGDAKLLRAAIARGDVIPHVLLQTAFARRQLATVAIPALGQPHGNGLVDRLAVGRIEKQRNRFARRGARHFGRNRKCFPVENYRVARLDLGNRNSRGRGGLGPGPGDAHHRSQGAFGRGDMINASHRDQGHKRRGQPHHMPTVDDRLGRNRCQIVGGPTFNRLIHARRQPVPFAVRPAAKQKKIHQAVL